MDDSLRDGVKGQVVVARPEAMDLVRYLQSLDRSYPVSSTVAQKGAQP